ncbi:MAG: Gfo/Idh/MocA family oxidoreductase, partial [bacterium]|nr:Gfo/Idh/MocA family oxidoreductase [bacterium]
MKKMKAGIIGVGRMGQYHLNILTDLPEVQVIGISDMNKEKLYDLSYKFGVSGFESCEKLIDKCDALFIATPTSTHYKIAKQCLEQGKHILLEKPMTTNLEEARDLTRIAEKHHLIIQVGHVERFNGAVQQLKNIVNSPIYLEAKRMGPYDPRVSDVGVVLDLMIHDIDILLNLIEEDVKEIDRKSV